MTFAGGIVVPLSERHARQEDMMKMQYRHGDVLVERVGEADPSTAVATTAPTLAEGEISGHSHRLFGGATLFRDDGLARALGEKTYIGTVNVPTTSELRHVGRDGALTGEHDTIAVPSGCYAVIGQREYDSEGERRAQD